VWLTLKYEIIVNKIPVVKPGIHLLVREKSFTVVLQNGTNEQIAQVRRLSELRFQALDRFEPETAFQSVTDQHDRRTVVSDAAGRDHGRMRTVRFPVREFEERVRVLVDTPILGSSAVMHGHFRALDETEEPVKAGFGRVGNAVVGDSLESGVEFRGRDQLLEKEVEPTVGQVCLCELLVQRGRQCFDREAGHRRATGVVEHLHQGDDPQTIMNLSANGHPVRKTRTKVRLGQDCVFDKRTGTGQEALDARIDDPGAVGVSPVFQSNTSFLGEGFGTKVPFIAKKQVAPQRQCGCKAVLVYCRKHVSARSEWVGVDVCPVPPLHHAQGHALSLPPLFVRAERDRTLLQELVNSPFVFTSIDPWQQLEKERVARSLHHCVEREDRGVVQIVPQLKRSSIYLGNTLHGNLRAHYRAVVYLKIT